MDLNPLFHNNNEKLVMTKRVNISEKGVALYKGIEVCIKFWDLN